MWKEIRWWLLGLTAFGMVFFPGVTVLILLGALYVLGLVVIFGLAGAFIVTMISLFA